MLSFWTHFFPTYAVDLEFNFLISFLKLNIVHVPWIKHWQRGKTSKQYVCSLFDFLKQAVLTLHTSEHCVLSSWVECHYARQPSAVSVSASFQMLEQQQCRNTLLQEAQFVLCGKAYWCSIIQGTRGKCLSAFVCVVLGFNGLYKERIGQQGIVCKLTCCAHRKHGKLLSTVVN